MKEEKYVIGKTFRNARTAKKISIEKASKETKISQSYLKAIEEEDFSRIPGDVVLKGFLRVYADFLGLDPAPLISELTKKNKKDKAVPAPAPVKTAKIRTYDAKRSFKAIALVVVLLLLTAGLFSFAGYLITSFRHTSEVKVPAVQMPESSEAGFEVRSEILERTWLLVESDGKVVFKGIAAPGDERTWKVEKILTVRAGNAAGLRLLSSDKELLAPGKRGEVISKEFFK